MMKRSLRVLPRSVRPRSIRPFTQSHRAAASHKDRQHTNVDQHREAQKSKPLNQHMPNTSSTLANEMPKVGNDSAPPEFLSSVDGNFKPSDKAPGNTEKMTGGTQAESASSSGSSDGSSGAGAAGSDLNVGEIEGGSFRVEPLRRTGEDRSTIIARLTYQSRKRGTLESDLLLSTFADAQLTNMTSEQLAQYDLFLDENDWDIYYWATQEPTPTSLETAEGSVSSSNSTSVNPQEQQQEQKGVSSKMAPAAPASGEWAQTVGTFKPAYRPVPQRWQGSEILTMLRQHVEQRKEDGMAFMPRLKAMAR